jgi:hypothetical protein
MNHEAAHPYWQSEWARSLVRCGSCAPSQWLPRHVLWLLAVALLAVTACWLAPPEPTLLGEPTMASIKDPAALASLFIVLVNAGLIGAMLGKLVLL